MLLAATIGICVLHSASVRGRVLGTRQRWDFYAAAVRGSSFYDLPAVLHWMTGNIGFHHIHHLSSRIPNYRLRECHEANPALRVGPRLNLRQSLRCARLALWMPRAGNWSHSAGHGTSGVDSVPRCSK